MKLLVATHNQGKVVEINAILASAGIECLGLAEANVTFDVEETASTFLGNATLKATQYAEMTGLLTLADDSGLEVDALDGAPGVYTARYGGAGLTQPQRNQLLLTNLSAVPDGQRSARFRCAMVLADGKGNMLAATTGVLEGTISFAPRGTGGFGYDPIFLLPERGQTLAELESAEKNVISHRKQALYAILPEIRAQIDPI